MFNLKELNSGQVVNITFDTELLVPLSNVTVLGVVNYEIAKTYSDVLVKHKNIVSTINDETISNNPDEYDYLIYKTANGAIDVAASCWIDNVTAVSKMYVSFKVTVENAEEISYIKQALASRGFNDVEYTTSTDSV